MFNQSDFKTEKPLDSDVKKLLIIARQHKNKAKRDAAKQELFLKCGSVFVGKPAKFKGMLRYKGIGKQYMYDNDDITSECWIAFQNAINNFGRLNKIMNRRAGEFDDHNIQYDYTRKNFIGYLKKVVDRHLYRVYDKNLRKMDKETLSVDSHNMSSVVRDMDTIHAHQDDISNMVYDIDGYGFTEDEAHLFRSRLNELPPSSYIKMFGVSQDTYYKTLDSIKEKVSRAIDYDVEQ